MNNKANEITSELSYVPIPEQGYIQQNCSAYDLQKLLKGVRVERGLIIHSTTVQEVIAASQEARGRWYFNIVVEAPVNPSLATREIGIDLGLKDVATCSHGLRLENRKIYRNLEEKLGKGQRANKKARARAIHAKIKNTRLDTLHKFTTQVVKENSFIVVGNVSSSALAKTKMAKAVLDAGWFMLKTQLDYKSKAMQAKFIEVNEAYTTQACSCCGCIGNRSPRGR